MNLLSIRPRVFSPSWTVFHSALLAVEIPRAGALKQMPKSASWPTRAVRIIIELSGWLLTRPDGSAL
jgi:hypothetical protein